jgi:hypothetical protein
MSRPPPIAIEHPNALSQQLCAGRATANWSRVGIGPHRYAESCDSVACIRDLREPHNTT